MGNHLDEMQQLVQNGTDVNTPNYDGRRAIHLAAACGHMEMLRFLVEAKATLTVTDRFGGTALGDALHNDQIEAANYLREHGLYLGNSDRNKSDLFHASAEGKIEKLQTLINYGLKLSAVDFDGRTALHKARTGRNLTSICFLVRQPGMDINHRDRFGYTALDEAEMSRDAELCTILSQAGAIETNLDQLSQPAASQQPVSPASHTHRKKPLLKDERTQLQALQDCEGLLSAQAAILNGLSDLSSHKIWNDSPAMNIDGLFDLWDQMRLQSKAIKACNRALAQCVVPGNTKITDRTSESRAACGAFLKALEHASQRLEQRWVFSWSQESPEVETQLFADWLSINQASVAAVPTSQHNDQEDDDAAPVRRGKPGVLKTPFEKKNAHGTISM